MATQTLGELETQRLAVVGVHRSRRRCRAHRSSPLRELITAQMPVSCVACASSSAGGACRGSTRTLAGRYGANRTVAHRRRRGGAGRHAARGCEGGEPRGHRIGLAASRSVRSKPVPGPRRTWCSRPSTRSTAGPTEAEATLAEVEGDIEDRALALEYLRQRTTGLQWGLGRSGRAPSSSSIARSHGGREDDWRRQVESCDCRSSHSRRRPEQRTPALEQALKRRCAQ